MRNVIYLAGIGLAVWASGANIAGRWSGEIVVNDPGSGRTIPVPVEVEFQQQENKISGRIGRRGEAEKAELSGSVNGLTVEFDVRSSETVKPTRFRLTLNDQKMEGQMVTEVEEGQVAGRVSLTRAP